MKRLLLGLLAAFVMTTPALAAPDNLLIAPTSSPAAEGARVFKVGPGNLYRLSITTGASAGYVMVFDAATAPADGTVTPAICRAVAASSTLSLALADPVARFGTGITAVFSTTGCFTKTISATAYFEGYFQ